MIWHRIGLLRILFELISSKFVIGTFCNTLFLRYALQSREGIYDFLYVCLFIDDADL